MLQLRQRILQLRDLVPAEVVLRAYGATIEDLELLAVVEEELKEISAEQQAQDD